ncbi:MAG TPA: hypothetical protein VM093_05250 [Aeromicrobium sp.]|nr:hypothetical protein [Aeromicrobium sp.]
MTHLLFVRAAVGPDEGGFSVVARYWNEPGRYLYGPLWVDRPPGLIWLFSLANHLGPMGVRWMLLILAVVLVALAGAAAAAAGGPRAAPWAAWAAYALGSSVLLQGQQLNGEYAAAVCVAASMLLTLLSAKSVGARAALLGFAAGAAATGAVTMKQNFLDAFVFAFVLLVAMAATGRIPWRRMAAALGGGIAGTAAVVALVLAWSRDRGGPSALMFALYGFRVRADSVMDHHSFEAPGERMFALIALCLGSGLLVLALQLAWQGRRALRARQPLAWALLATAVFEFISLMAGANFWPHYALAFIPVIAVGTGLASRPGKTGWRATRYIVGLAAVTTAVISPIAAVAKGPGDAWMTGHWVSRSAQPGDTIAVTYSHPNIIDASGLRPAYPYLWSLPIRTLDPHLALLDHTLTHEHRPTWVVVFNASHSWDLNKSDELQRALHPHYRLVEWVCGHPVWLAKGEARKLVPVPPGECGAGAL